jgi:predicted tellurium resistance membrane protein TerC
LTLVLLEIVLGIDNIIFVVILVDRGCRSGRRRSARFVGSGFAMLTRIALLLSVVWIATLRKPLFGVRRLDISVRDVMLFAGGAFLVVKSVEEIAACCATVAQAHRRMMRGFWLIIVQIGILDIVFSLDSVFTAIGLANRAEVMIAAIVVSVLVMMAVSSAVSRFIDRYPTIKALALAFPGAGGDLAHRRVGARRDSAGLFVFRDRLSRQRWNGSTFACDGGGKV